MTQPANRPIQIIFVHLLDNYSGSPRVLREVLRVVQKKKIPAKLYLGNASKGFLTEGGFPTEFFFYRRGGWKPLNLLSFLLSQALLFFKLLFDRSIAQNALVYVNTLRPFGAALYGRLTGRKVLTHLHESFASDDLLLAPLRRINRMTSSLNLYVSDSHLKSFLIPGPPAKRVYSSLDGSFLKTASRTRAPSKKDGLFHVLMVSSLNDFKGIPELLEAASGLVSQARIRFQLLLNAGERDITAYFSNKQVPPNLTIYPKTSEVVPFYRQAHLLLNLTRTDLRAETFGLTVLEAMTFGIPVIVPPLGGTRELAREGLHGFGVDSRNQALLREKILFLFKHQKERLKMSKACRKRAADFTPEDFEGNILESIQALSLKGRG